jgi:hypothetical protein
MKRSVLVSLFATIALMLFNLAAVFGQSTNANAVTSQEAFAMLKNLAGEWQGTVQEKDKGPAATVSYKVTANGSVVVETLFPGTDHEMITTYHFNGDQLMLTHYCVSGNQPKMVLSSQSTKNLLTFDFAGGTNLKSERDMHMHSGRIKLIDNDHIESEWDSFNEGKNVGVNKFFLTRKK